ncbi:MAG: nucleoside deaminase [Myxococcales bacterium]|nr:MAG: nucleoside deaminase [Myxococcales bacterium]
MTEFQAYEYDINFMSEALAEARKAYDKNEVPVGCVIVHQGQIVGRGHNLRESSQDPRAHAEMMAIKEAARALGSWRLVDTTLYVTLEPCPMCAGALVNSRISRLVYGCRDPKAGAIHSLYQLGDDQRLNHRFSSVEGVLGSEAGALLSEFFQAIRQNRLGSPRPT